MKIHVIDNNGLINPQLLIAQADVSYFDDEIQAINAAEALKPELILLCYAMRREETPAYIDLLLSLSSSTSIVLIGDGLSDQQVLSCLLVGAKGYLNSSDLSAYIGKILKVIPLGEAWVTRRLTARLLDFIRMHNCVEVGGY